MLIAKVQDNQVLEVADYRAMFPNTSFPPSGPSESFMADNDLLGVTVWKAHDLEAEKLVPAEPYIENSQVFTVAVAPLTEEELQARADSKAASVRAERNARLAACDWTQLDDANLDNALKLEWRDYRQALRDISSQSGFPHEVVWPLRPGETADTI